MSEYHEVLYLSDAGQWFLVGRESGEVTIISEEEGWRRAMAMERALCGDRTKEG